MVTIQDVANASGVSITTVSHVLNHTRYVSPKVEQRVHTAIRELNYHPLRHRNPENPAAMGKSGYIGFIIDRKLLTTCGCRSYVRMAADYGWVTIAADDVISEKQLFQIKRQFHLKKLMVHSSVELQLGETPRNDLGEILLVNQEAPVGPTQALQLILDYEAAVRFALEHLAGCGHSNIMVIGGCVNAFCRRQITSAVRSWAAKYRISTIEDRLLWLDGDPYDLHPLEQTDLGTAIITVGMLSLQSLMRYCTQHSLTIPGDFSLVAVDDDCFVADNFPGITSVQLNPQDFSAAISGEEATDRCVICPPRLEIHDSVCCIPLDPQGSEAGNTASLELSLTEKLLVRRRKVKIGISISNAGTLFSEMLVQGMREVAANLDITLLPVQDAKSSSEMQANQLAMLLQQNADAIISVSNDHREMTDAFTSIMHRHGTPLVLGSHLPISLPEYAYRTCIATNEEEKGRLVAKFLADEMQRKNQRKAVLIFDSNSFAGAQQCAASVVTTLSKDYPQIEVLEQINHKQGNRAMMEFEAIYETYPELAGIYAQDAGVAGEICDFLRRKGREDVTVVTSQINTRFAKQVMLDESNSLGIVSSRPIEMGHWMIYAAAAVILGKPVPPYITVDPIVLEKKNVGEIWPLLTQSRLV